MHFYKLFLSLTEWYFDESLVTEYWSGHMSELVIAKKGRKNKEEHLKNNNVLKRL